MKITVNGLMMVKPMKETPSGSLRLSNADLIFPPYHTSSVQFYRCSGAGGFFEAAVLKAALSRALVDFYPYAGRLRDDGNGRIEINCTGEGAAFIEADCDGAVADLGGFSPNPNITLVPTVDYSGGISSFPLFLVQLTRFRCGGVCLGFANEHHISDGISALHFLTTWSEIARGIAAPAVPPSLDRRPLAARDPPRPRFPHTEYHRAPSPETPLHDSQYQTRCSTFRLTRGQVNALKRRCEANHTTYEVVTGHVWRCATAARGLRDDQETKLQFPVDARRRLRPPLPPGFFGNAIFLTGASATRGELVSKPLAFAAGKVSEAIGQMDDEYLRSAVDYIEVNPPGIVRRGGGGANFPNLRIVSWVKLPLYEEDYGWGKPAYVGPGVVPFEGKSYLCVDPESEEGDLLLIITLYQNHMNLFEELLYDALDVSE